MKNTNKILILTGCMGLLALFATLSAIFMTGGPGEFSFTSIYGQKLTIYGKGLYAFNTKTAVLQAIPHDWVTLCVALPLLIGGMISTVKGSVKGRLFLTGVTAYLFITYSIYTFMAMLNPLFLVYVAVMSVGLFALIYEITSFDESTVKGLYSSKTPIRWIGGYLMAGVSLFGLLWLMRVVPFAMGGTMPLEVEHGTTLPVQAFDLAFFLPLTFISGWLLANQKSLGYVVAPVALLSNALVMTALVGKVISMTMGGVENLLPMMVITGSFMVASYGLFFVLMGNMKEGKGTF